MAGENMIKDDFIVLIQQSGLNYINSNVYDDVDEKQNIVKKQIFIVSLYVERSLGTRIECGFIDIPLGEFASIGEEEAQSKIDVCKMQLMRAARTKQGTVRDGSKRKNVQKVQENKVGEEEKYLKKMRKRGEVLAKTVRYAT